MTAKEYLSQIFQIHKKIIYYEHEIERYQMLMNYIPHPHYKNDQINKLSSNTTPNMIGLEKYYETKDKIIAVKEKHNRLVLEITQVIEKIENDDYKLVLKYRYINMISFIEISRKLYVSYSTVKRIHAEALKLVEVTINSQLET